MALNFQAFIDDSRQKVGGSEFVLAGHIATADKWVEFTKEWEPLLPLGTKAKNGKYHFKMTEMAFARRIEHVEKFYRVIEKHVALSISCRMNEEEFVRAQVRAKNILSQHNVFPDFGNWANPYYFLFRALIDNFHKDRHGKISKIIPIEERIDFIFDDQDEKKFIRDAWDGWVAYRDDEVRSRYGGVPQFENDQEYLALQGADLWAWWVRRWYEEDAIDLPDKMREFDFGSWRGKKRPLTYFSINEDQIVDMFLRITFEILPHTKPTIDPF
jgi:Protein of unknown function (DUF3800)